MLDRRLSTDVLAASDMSFLISWSWNDVRAGISSNTTELFLAFYFLAFSSLLLGIFWSLKFLIEVNVDAFDSFDIPDILD